MPYFQVSKVELLHALMYIFSSGNKPSLNTPNYSKAGTDRHLTLMCILLFILFSVSFGFTGSKYAFGSFLASNCFNDFTTGTKRACANMAPHQENCGVNDVEL